MALLSWIFPNEEERLRRVRAKMAAGDFANARKEVMHCRGPEADALYEECSSALDGEARVGVKKQLAAQGFHGWKVEVSARGARRKAELEKLAAQELTKAGVDLDLPELDQEAAKAALLRLQRRLAASGKEPVEIRLAPVLDAKGRKAFAKMERDAKAKA